MLHHIFVHMQQDSHVILFGFALLGEILWFPAMIIMIVQGFKRKQCGMPMVGICAFGGICLIWSTFGPYLQPDLFPKNGGEWTVWMWRAYLVLMLILFYQSLKFGKNQTHLNQRLKDHHVFLGLALFAFFTITEWWFITYFKDTTTNEISPLAVLFIPFGYLAGLYLRHEYEGLSVKVGWLMTLTHLFIYGSVLPMMEVAYPGHDNYNFMYWILGLTVAMFLFYTLQLGKGKKELALRKAAEVAAG